MNGEGKPQFFILELADVERIERVASTLYTENRMNGDEMRGLAQALDATARRARELPWVQE